MRARVHVMLKPGVLDPQGRAIARALVGHGFKSVQNVRQGKVFDLYLEETDPVRAREQIEQMCLRLLANTVIETYEIEITS